MKRLGNVKGLVKPIISLICIVGVLSMYTLPAEAATKKIKSGSEVSGTLEDGDEQIYQLKVTQKTKFKLTATAAVNDEESDEEDYEEDYEDYEDYEDLSDIEEEDEYLELDDEELDESEYEADIYEDYGDEEDDLDVSEDEDIEESSDGEYITVDITSGKKTYLKAFKVESMGKKSQSITLVPGTYQVKVTAKADFDIDYSLLLSGKACKVTFKVADAKQMKVKSSYELKVKGKDLGKITYKSSNSKIAKVNAKGKVTAVKAGSCKITVKVKGAKKAATCKITVK